MPMTPKAVLLQANALQIPLADQSVHMVLTSPPYWGLRDYQTAEWEGGTHECTHVASERWYTEKTAAIASHEAFSTPGQANVDRLKRGRWRESGHCIHCGAVRIDHQLGLEKVPDCLGWATGENCGSCYLCHMRAVMQECWRVLRDDGTCWIVIADSYSNDGKWGGTTGGKHVKSLHGQPIGRRKRQTGLKPKDLCLIPQRLALALQADGWTVRSDIVWNKSSCMPEPVQDRPTRSHEYVWLLTKQARYFYDAEAVREAGSNNPATLLRNRYADTSPPHGQKGTKAGIYGGASTTTIGDYRGENVTRNVRSVWTIASEPTPFAHFATMPTALARRCILAGTSAYGVCSVCRTPWVRVVKRQRLLDGTMPVHGAFCRPEDPFRAPVNGTDHRRYSTVTSELGWRPTCAHPDAPVVPATVLDPFCGSSTTLLVARELRRYSIGIDLSWTYLHDISRKRLGAKALKEWEEGAEPIQESFADLPLFSLTSDNSTPPGA
jgi:DNA modification methylase